MVPPALEYSIRQEKIQTDSVPYHFQRRELARYILFFLFVSPFESTEKDPILHFLFSPSNIEKSGVHRFLYPTQLHLSVNLIVIFLTAKILATCGKDFSSD